MNNEPLIQTEHEHYDDCEPASRCQTCDGDGVEWCDDWDCWERDCTGDSHLCPNCKGSGLASDQWFW